MKDNIVIVGGGIAGMEAARQLLLLGFHPPQLAVKSIAEPVSIIALQLYQKKCITVKTKNVFYDKRICAAP